MFYQLYQEAHPAAADAGFSWPATLLNLPAPPENWQLTVGGEVQQPLTLTLEELQKTFPVKIQSRRWVSVHGWSVRAQWEGFLLQHLVEKVRPVNGVRYVKQTSLSGEVETLALKEALIHRTLLCFQANGRPLTPLYGGPLQLMCFHRYSYKGLGQLASIEFVSDDAPLRSQQLGLPAHGEFTPGQYLAVDLNEMRPIKRSAEVEDY
jgi:DMSO/TMAO reductase YedYZ molybdopterin-dependent catalytic subunit